MITNFIFLDHKHWTSIERDMNILNRYFFKTPYMMRRTKKFSQGLLK